MRKYTVFLPPCEASRQKHLLSIKQALWLAVSRQPSGAVVNIMHSRLVSLVKLFTLEMDKFIIRSGGSKLSETSKEPEKRKSKGDKDDRKRTRLFKDSWFSDFTWLCKDDNSDTLYCHVCRMFPQSADTTSALYTGKSIETLLRKDTLTAHQTSSKHVSCVSKYEFKQKPSKQGPIEKSISKVEMHEISVLTVLLALYKHAVVK